MPPKMKQIGDGKADPGEIVDVPVGIDTPAISEAEAFEFLKEMGLTQMKSCTLTKLRKLGIHLRGTGVLSTQRGGAFINQQRLDEAMRIVAGCIIRVGSRKKIDIDALHKGASALSLLSARYTESQKLMLGLESLVKVSVHDEVEITNRAFAPDMDIQPRPQIQIAANSVHLHSTAKEGSG